MIQEAYVSFETAKLLKEKGFDEECTHYYSYESNELIEYTNGVYSRNSKNCNRCVSPTHQMAMAWLREKGIYITIIYGDYPANKRVFWTPQIDSLEGFDLPDSFYQEYNSYEDAVEAALKYVLENLI